MISWPWVVVTAMYAFVSGAIFYALLWPLAAAHLVYHWRGDDDVPEIFGLED